MTGDTPEGADPKGSINENFIKSTRKTTTLFKLRNLLEFSIGIENFWGKGKSQTLGRGGSRNKCHQGR